MLYTPGALPRMSPTNTKRLRQGLCDWLSKVCWFSLTASARDLIVHLLKKVKIQTGLYKRRITNIPDYPLTTRTACRLLSRWSGNFHQLLGELHLPGTPVHPGPARVLSGRASVLLLKTQVQKIITRLVLTPKALTPGSSYSHHLPAPAFSPLPLLPP